MLTMQFFNYASKITSILGLVSFIVAAVLYAVLKGKQKPLVMAVAIGSMTILGTVLILADLFSHKVYRLRVTVIGTANLPVEDATVTSDLGGEVKKVSGGWELDINPQTIPLDKKITIYAEQKDAFLTAFKDTLLGDDYNPAIRLKLSKDATARIGGTVIDSRKQGISGAAVYVDGFMADSVLTGRGGVFSLPSHAASGEKVRIFAGKRGYESYSEYYAAGDNNICVTLKTNP